MGQEGRRGEGPHCWQQGGGRYYAIRVRRASVPPQQQCHQDSGACPSSPSKNVVRTDGGAGGKKGTVEL
jgi:hypothetical protein